MKYTRLDVMPYYKECAQLVEGMGFSLVSIRIEGKGNVQRSSPRKVSCVVAPKAGKAFGVDECARVHRALLARLESLLGGDLSLQVSSPGLERNIKNAAEFALFEGFPARLVFASGRVLTGKILAGADEQSVKIESEGGEVETVKYCDIESARLMDESGKESGKGRLRRQGTVHPPCRSVQGDILQKREKKNV